MPHFLRHREPDAVEFMDDPECDRGKLFNTYRRFRYVNAVLSSSRAIYRRWLRPAMIDKSLQYTALDIGFGGGDMAIKLARRAARDGYKLDITGIDTDRRAFDYVADLPHPDNVHFRHAGTKELVANGERYDFVLSNHLLHHLDKVEFSTLLHEAVQLSHRFALMIDLRRSDIAYGLFSTLALPLSFNSYIRVDGLASLRRSYTMWELRGIKPSGWALQRLFPFRLALCYRHGR